MRQAEWIFVGGFTFAASSPQQSSRKKPENTSGGSNRIPYTQRDIRGSTTPTETVPLPADSSRSNLPSTTSIPQRREEKIPPYNTWGAEGSSQQGELSRTTYGPYPPTGTTRSPGSTIPTETMGTTAYSSRSPSDPTTLIPRRKEEGSSLYDTRGSGWGREGHPSQVHGALRSQRQENFWDGRSSPPSSGRDSSSNPSAGATGSHPWGGQPTGPPPEWFAHPPQRVFFSSISAPKFLTTILSGFDRRPAHERNSSSLTVSLPRFTSLLTSL